MLSDGPTAQDIYQQLYADHAGAVLQYLTNKLRDPDTAQDVAQDAWLKAHRGLPDVLGRGDTAGKPWLMRIATNAMTDHWRRVQARPKALGMDDLLASGAAVPDVLTDWDTPEAAALGAAETAAHRADAALLLELLPRNYRVMLWLYEWRGYRYEQIATALHTTVPAVKALLWRARIAQRVLWDREQSYRTHQVPRATGGGVAARLWSHVRGGRDWALAHPDSCWVWAGSCNSADTPELSVHTHLAPKAGTKSAPRRALSARRLLYAVERAALPPWVLLSPCPMRTRCVNPAHAVASSNQARVGQGSARPTPCDPAVDQPAMGMSADARFRPELDGAHLRERRQRLGLRQRDVAAAAGVHANQIGRLERGYLTSPPTALTVRRVLRALEVSTAPALDSTACRVRRLALSCSLAHLARKAGVTAETLSLFERGRCRPWPATLRCIAAALDRLERERAQEDAA